MRARLLALAAVAGLLQPVAAGAEPGRASASWPSVQVWRQPQGLPQNSVLTMLQTRDGYLWLGTKGGLSRFDGVRFTTFDDRDKTQLRESEVWALAEGLDGSLWIGTYGGGVSRLKDGKFTVYTTADGLVNNYVSSLLADESDGSVWIGTEARPQPVPERSASSTTPRRTALAGGGARSCIATPTAACGSAPSKGPFTDWPTAACRCSGSKGPRRAAEVWSMVRDRENAMWLGTLDGLFKIDERPIDAIHHRRRPGVEPHAIGHARLRTACCGSAPRAASPRTDKGIFTAHSFGAGARSSST